MCPCISSLVVKKGHIGSALVAVMLQTSGLTRWDTAVSGIRTRGTFRKLILLSICKLDCFDEHGININLVKFQLNRHRLSLKTTTEINPPASLRVWLEGVVPVLFLACTRSFVLFLRVFASSELCPPSSPSQSKSKYCTVLYTAIVYRS